MSLNFYYRPFLTFVTKESDSSTIRVCLAYFLRILKAVKKFVGSELFFCDKALRGVLDFFEETSGLLLNIEGLFNCLSFLANFD
jgi:hypothetical protein